ncbi:MAG: polymer-forming cytoskeletal protein [Clostridia bacterium]|nr:polymer-forming cytoskeletal protein [Clostridia bacterium]
MSFKENFMQAAHELMAGAPQPAMATNGVRAASVPDFTPSVIKDASSSPSRREGSAVRETTDGQKNFHTQATPAPSAPAPRSFDPEGGPRRTVIAEGTVIRGSVRTTVGVELHGEVYGDIVSKEDLVLSGKLEGNAGGRDIELCGGRIKGNIQSSGRVRIDSNSVVIGNIQAGTLLLNGRVKGDLEIKESVALDVHAAVAGNVTAGKLSIAEGAMLQGEVRISSADLGKLFAENGAGDRPREQRPVQTAKPEPLPAMEAKGPASAE